jgi:NAD(P)-dependent dehydrogenase (short-subunit alcohol dehydrogenase family)
VCDLSLMKNIQSAVQRVKNFIAEVDVVIYTVGILISRTEHTEEGIEKDFAVSYLSRFAFSEELYGKGLFTSDTVMLNVAASAAKVPKFAQMEFDTLEEVQSRVGMKSHGQAQLANDLFIGFAPKRYGITTIGYGPGSVKTSIRRELPKFLMSMIQPFFHFSTREPQEIALQLVEILTDTALIKGEAQYFDKNGRFAVNPFIGDTKRQNALLKTSLALTAKTLS